ncbi:MAG: response regulator [Methanomicrobiales archaeon]|nr:response regulator [Methanomicrobiales archaeon]
MVYEVMVVDDDVATLEVMNLILRRIGYEPHTSRNGLEALDWLRIHCPDLILLDLQMVPIDGWEFLRRLREDPSLHQAPVMLFTARPLFNEEKERADRNVEKVLEKPISPLELKKELTTFFAERK